MLARRWNDDFDDSDDHRDAQPRVGALVNYSPNRVLDISEPFDNSIAALSLTDHGLIVIESSDPKRS